MAKKKAAKRKTAKPKLHNPEEEREPSTLDQALQMVQVGNTLKRITDLSTLLHDVETLAKVAEQVSTGASVASVEASIGLPPGLMRSWLKLGREDPGHPVFGTFYQFYSQAAAAARHAAEAQLLAKNPSAWLDRCDVLKQLSEAEPPEPDTVEGEAKPKDSDLKPSKETGGYDAKTFSI